MSVIKDNSNYEKTSFLSKSNNAFIEEMYLNYIRGDKNLPISWKNFFESLNESDKDILNELQGPSWSPKKINFKKINEAQNLSQKINIEENSANLDKQKQDSIKAIALIRAYRIRGHLNANLDPLGMMERKYLHELHPADHGFKKEEYNRKIYLHEYLDRGYATIKELLSFLRKTYCSTIGV